MTYYDPVRGYAWINDGSKLRYESVIPGGRVIKGIAVILPQGYNPPSLPYPNWGVTGIMMDVPFIPVVGMPYPVRLLAPRDGADIVQLIP